MNHTDGMTHSLAEPIFWIAAAICVVAELAILRSASCRARVRSNRTPFLISSRGIEMIWAIVPAVALAGFCWRPWRAVNH